jgi:hypothetical protein
MNVELENIKIYEAFRRCINSTPLEEIHWFENGEEIIIDKEVISEFEDIGLNNIDFATMEYWKRV